MLKKTRQKIKKLGKKLTNPLPWILVGASILPGCVGKNIKTQREKYPFSPRIEANFQDPRTDSEANTKLKNSAISLVGESLDYIAQKAEEKLIDPAAFQVRALESLINISTIATINLVSHEYSHFRSGEKHGAINPTVKIDFFGDGLYNNKGLKDKNPDAWLETVIAGPNQEFLNIQDLFRSSQIRNTKHYEHLAKLSERVNQFRYLDEGDESANVGGTDDYKNIEQELNKKGYDVSKSKMIKNDIILNLLSPDNFNSLAALSEFLIFGKREFKPCYIKAGKFEFGLPNITRFFTTEGEFATISEFIRYPGMKPLEVNISHDLDFTQKKAGVNRIRIGGKIYGIEAIQNRLHISPYAHVNLERNHMHPNGSNAGIESKLKINDNISLTGKLEYNNNDLEAEIKEKDNGFYFTTGFEMKF